MMRRLVVCAALFAAACKTIAPVEPPQFDYPAIMKLADPGERIPLTIQRGASVHPSSTQDGILFFASNRDGSADIWLRDLKSTVAFPIVRHPAEQTRPSVPLSGDRVAFVSYDLDAGGDIRIAGIKPAETVRAVLAGSTPPNLWTESVSLGDLIQEIEEELPVQCRGSFMENDPAFSPDGKYLYFVSDRCTRGTPNLFRVRLSDLEVTGPPELLFPGGAAQPSLNLDGSKAAFVSTSGAVPELVILDLRTKASQRFTPPGISQYPVLSPDGGSLYYVSVRRDTNANGRLDALDAAGIYVRSAASPGKEQRLVDDASSLHGMAFSFFIGGSLLYAAESWQNVNIYFTRPEGIVPREQTIDDQLLAVSRYKEPLKKLLALDAFERYWGAAPESEILEGKYLLARVDASSGEEKAENQTRLDEARKASAFTDYTLGLLAVPREKSRAEFIQKFLESLDTLEAPSEKKDRFAAAALDDLSRALETEGRREDSLAALKRLNENHPSYFRRPRTRFRQAVLELKLGQRVPESMIALLNDPAESVARKEELISEIVGYFLRLRGAQAQSAAARELERSDLPEVVRASLDYVRAKAHFDRGANDEALALLRPLETKFAPDSGMYVRTMQLLSFVLERKRDFDGAYEARTKYGGAYRPEMGVRVGLEEYREILDLSDRMIRRYLSAARSVAALVDEEDAILSKRLLSRTLEGTPVQSIVLAAQEKPVLLRASDIEVLAELCNPRSRAAGLVATLGQKDYLTAYAQLCTKNAAYFNSQNEDGLKLEAARSAADLLYIVSYANANILNILFYNMKKVNLFEKFHEERSIEYHRLKIDIAMERNRIRIEWDRRKIALLDPRNVLTLFTEGDPFDATAFNEVVHGYRFAANEARAAGELSFLYGYAYALIQKSHEREAFYDRLALEGSAVPEDQRRAKKQDVLRDLKTAEYLLQYILYVDPANADAYLLLGWMYQYIDDRRGRSIARTEGYLDRLVNFLTRTRAAQATDGQYFIDIYRAYFPDRLFETNVELYRQAVQLIEAARPGHESSGDLHLNLANNYFQLLNFQKAVEHYNRAEDLSSSAVGTKAGLFYFNRGRAYYYEGQTQNSARDLRRALDHYTERELKPAEMLLATTGYRLGGSGNESERLKLLQEEQQKALDEARLRTALVGALYGLALWESGRYAESSRAYENADAQLRRMKNPDQRLRAGVLNYLSMARQEQRRIEESDRHARASQEIVRGLGLSRDDDRYQPQSIGGRLLGCVLPYGEDFSVIGDGRNPYGLSTLRLYELSTGILLENRLLAGDRTGALAILEEREDIFSGKDGDVRLGQVGALTVQNRRAYEEFTSTHYREAADLFGQAAREAQAGGFLDQARKNYLNRFHSLFAWFDADGTVDTAAEIARALEDLDNFRGIYRESAKTEFIVQEQTENPDFEYDPALHDAQLEARVARRLRDFFAVEAGLYYYRGRSADRAAENAVELESAREDYTRALALYERLIATGDPEPRDPSFYRLRLNRIEILRRLGKTEAAMSQLSSIIEDLEEFSLVHEEYSARSMLAFLAADRFEERGEAKDAALAREQFLAAFEVLRDYPVIRTGGPAEEAFYRRAADYLIRRGEPAQALSLLETAWAQRLHDEYMRYPVSFQNEDARTALEIYMESRKEAAAALLREQSLRFTRQNAKEARARRISAFAASDQARKRLAALLPSHRAFLEQAPVRIPEPGKVAARLFYEGGWLNAFVAGSFRPLLRFQGTPEQTMEAFLKELPRVRDVFLVPDAEIYALDLDALRAKVRPDLPRFVFISRLSDSLTGSGELPPGLNLFNARDESVSFETGDVLRIASPFADDFFAVEPGRFPAREFLARPRNFSLAYTAESAAPVKHAFAYEVFRAGGVYAFAAGAPDTKPVLPGEGSMAVEGWRIWGAPGFLRSFAVRQARTARESALSRAQAEEKLKRYRQAAEEYRLASSISHSIGDEPAALDEAVRSAGTLMLVDAPSGEAAFAALIESANGAGRVFVLEALITSQVKIGQFARAVATAERYSSSIEGTPASAMIETAKFLQALEDAEQRLPSSEFERLQVRLADPAVAPAAIEVLLRRAMHAEASALAKTLPPAARAAALLRVNVSRSLLDGQLSQELETVLDQEPGVRELAGFSRRALSGQLLSAAEIREDIDPSRTSSIALSALVGLYVRAAEGDPGYLAARLALEAIELEKTRSPERACLLSLLLAEKYAQDPPAAVRFLDAAKAHFARSVPSAELKQRYAASQARLAFLDGREVEFPAENRPTASTAALANSLPALETPALRQFAQTLNAFVKEHPGLRGTALAAVERLKARAAEEKKASVLLNLETMASRSASGKPFSYEETAERLLARLPSGQTFTALVAARGSLWRVRMFDGRIVQDMYSEDARSPRILLARSLYLRTRSSDHELAVYFRRVVTARTNTPAYFYLPAGLRYAPVYTEPGDRVYLVPSLAELAARPFVREGAPFAEEFAVNAPGPRRDEATDGEDAWFERLRTMEETALGRTGSGDILHVYSERGLNASCTGPWTLSLPRHRSGAAETVAAYEDDLLLLAEGCAAPGIAYADTGSGEWYALFLRAFYDRDTGIGQLDKRYLDAQVRLRRAGLGPVNVRMVSPAFIVE